MRLVTKVAQTVTFPKHIQIFSLKPLGGLSLCFAYIIITFAHLLFQSDENSGCYGRLNFPLSYNGKSGNCFVTVDISTKFYNNVSGEVLFQPCRFCPND